MQLPANWRAAHSAGSSERDSEGLLSRSMPYWSLPRSLLRFRSSSMALWCAMLNSQPVTLPRSER